MTSFQIEGIPEIAGKTFQQYHSTEKRTASIMYESIQSNPDGKFEFTLRYVDRPGGNKWAVYDETSGSTEDKREKVAWCHQEDNLCDCGKGTWMEENDDQDDDAPSGVDISNAEVVPLEQSECDVIAGTPADANGAHQLTSFKLSGVTGVDSETSFNEYSGTTKLRGKKEYLYETANHYVYKIVGRKTKWIIVTRGKGKRKVAWCTQVDLCNCDGSTGRRSWRRKSNGQTEIIGDGKVWSDECPQTIVTLAGFDGSIAIDGDYHEDGGQFKHHDNYLAMVVRNNGKKRWVVRDADEDIKATCRVSRICRCAEGKWMNSDRTPIDGYAQCPFQSVEFQIEDKQFFGKSDLWMYAIIALVLFGAIYVLGKWVWPKRKSRKGSNVDPIVMAQMAVTELCDEDLEIYAQQSKRDLELGSRIEDLDEGRDGAFDAVDSELRFGSDGLSEERREDAVVVNGKEVAASHLDGRKVCEQHLEEEVGHAL